MTLASPLKFFQAASTSQARTRLNLHNDKQLSDPLSNYPINKYLCHMIRWFYPQITIQFNRPESGFVRPIESMSDSNRRRQCSRLQRLKLSQASKFNTKKRKKGTEEIEEKNRKGQNKDKKTYRLWRLWRSLSTSTYIWDT